MKKILILLLAIILPRIIYSTENISNQINQDSIVYITSKDLKYTNLIFVEHKKLFNNNILLNKQIKNYQLKIDNLEKIDSLRLEQINNYQQLNEQYNLTIEQLNKDLNKKDNYLMRWKVGFVVISTGLFFTLLFR